MEGGGKAENQSLIVRFFTGDISDDEMGLLKAWLESDPENRRIFNEENELWQEAGFQTITEHHGLDAAWLNISSRLGLGKNNYKSVRILRKNNFRILIAAATIACLVAVGGAGLWITGKRSLQKMASSSIRVNTNDGEKAHIFLSDSTEIILNSGSTLQYDGQYNIKDRSVKLTGEAFFNVFKDKNRTFTVNTDEVNVKVLGTRFSIASYKNENNVEVVLEEGKLVVNDKGLNNPHAMNPNDLLIYDKTNKSFSIDVVQPQKYLSWTEGKLVFRNDDLEAIARRLERWYNIDVEIIGDVSDGHKLRATFIDKDVEEVLKLLKLSLPIDYIIEKQKIGPDDTYSKKKVIIYVKPNNISQ